MDAKVLSFCDFVAKKKKKVDVKKRRDHLIERALRTHGSKGGLVQKKMRLDRQKKQIADQKGEPNGPV